MWHAALGDPRRHSAPPQGRSGALSEPGSEGFQVQVLVGNTGQVDVLIEENLWFSQERLWFI